MTHSIFFCVEARHALDIGIYKIDNTIKKEKSLTVKVYARLGTHSGFELRNFGCIRCKSVYNESKRPEGGQHAAGGRTGAVALSKSADL